MDEDEAYVADELVDFVMKFNSIGKYRYSIISISKKTR